MSAATERAMARRVALLEKRLAILQARFNQMDKAAAIMGASWQPAPATPSQPRPRWLHAVE